MEPVRFALSPAVITLIITIIGIVVSVSIAYGVTRHTVNKNQEELTELKNFHHDQIARNGQFVTMDTMRNICMEGRNRCREMNDLQATAIQKDIQNVCHKVDVLSKRVDDYIKSREKLDAQVIEAIMANNHAHQD